MYGAGRLFVSQEAKRSRKLLFGYFLLLFYLFYLLGRRRFSTH